MFFFFCAQYENKEPKPSCPSLNRNNKKENFINNQYQDALKNALEKQNIPLEQRDAIIVELQNQIVLGTGAPNNVEDNFNNTGSADTGNGQYYNNNTTFNASKPEALKKHGWLSGFGVIWLDILFFIWAIPALFAIIIAFFVSFGAIILLGGWTMLAAPLQTIGINFGWLKVNSPFSLVNTELLALGVVAVGVIFAYPTLWLGNVGVNFVKLCGNLHSKVFVNRIGNTFNYTNLRPKFFRKRVWLVVLPVFLVCGVVSFAAITSEQSRINKQELLSVTTNITDDITALNVDVADAKVNVYYTTDTPRTEILYYENYELSQKVSGGTLNITEKYNNGQFGINFDWLMRKNAVVNVYLNDDAVGDIVIFKDFFLSTVSGDIYCEMPAENFTIDTVSGDVNLKNICGKLDATSVSGNIIANNIANGAKIDTVSGNIKLSFLAGAFDQTIKTDTVSGNTDIILPSGSGLNADTNTVSGTLKFNGNTLPKNGNAEHSGSPLFHLDFDSVSGNLYVRS